MVSKEEFKRYINELIENDVKKDELASLAKSNGGSSTGFIIIGIILTFIGLFFIGIPLFIIGIIMSSKNSKLSNYLLSTYKDKIINFLLKDNDYTFKQNNYISESIFRESQFDQGQIGFFRTSYDIYEGEDLLRINIPNDDGSKSNNDLVICDLNIVDIQRDDEGNETRHTIYKGTFGHIQFPFQFKCALCINSNYRKSNLKLYKIELEDIVFNKKFRILSSDQIEARYILTPKMMENILMLRKSLGTLKITLVDNKMFIGFPSKNLFKFKSMSNNCLDSIFDNFYTDIEAILSIVNELKTNNKVFKI